MKALQGKCLVASAVTHGLLLGLVLIGSAFLPHRKPPESVAFTLVAIPAMLVDEPNVIGGGNPKAGLPNIDPAPPEPVVQQAAAPAARPEPKPEPKAEPRPTAPEPKPEPKPVVAEPKFDFSETVNRKAEPKAETRERAEPNFDFSSATRKTIKPSPSPRPAAGGSAEPSGPSAREAQLASAAGQAMARVQRGLSTGVGEIGIPGPGGPAYASYNLALGKYYEDRWITPQTYSDNEPVVVAEVTIQGDGTVLSHRILRRSNRRALDDSVEKTLGRVKKVPAFPSGNSEEKRTFKINFNLSSKLNLG